MPHASFPKATWVIVFAEEEGKLQSCEEILDKVFYRIKTGPHGQPPWRAHSPCYSYHCS
jgi:hypothetical protein